MANFLHKKIWSDTEWSIFNKNIEYLRNYHHLKKSEFSEILGVKNFFRKDRNKVSKTVVRNICNQFDVDENWLCTDRQDRNNFISLMNKHAGGLNENGSNYDLHGDPPNISIEELTGIPAGKGMGKAIELLVDIYDSKNKKAISTVFDVLKVFSRNVKK